MDIRQVIEKEGVIITDGSMGAYLQELGYLGITPECASIDMPDLVASVHKEYIESGASVILTNTFGANKKRLARKNLANKIEDINIKSGEIAKRVSSQYKGILVAGDIGPSGEFLEPYGNLTMKEAEDIFVYQAKFLQETGVDLILLETFQDLKEIEVAYNSIKAKYDCFIIPSLTLSSGGENRTLMGQKIEDLLEWAEKIGVLGINCGLTSREMESVVSKIRKISEIPLWVKPNAGIPQVSDGNITYPESIEEFTENCVEMVNKGIKFIGGCCGTTPKYIKNLKKVIYETD
ncbi:homocysteine S-methyltransferase family protein [bacterium]|nr:homocysteine S-methyltransferase family protein [bacterium]